MQALINTNAELKQFVTVSSGMEIQALLPYLTNSEAEKQVKDVTGQTVYTELLSAYINNTLNERQQELLPYVQKPLANFAIWQHVNQGGVIVSNSGVTLTTERDKQAFQWQQIKLEQSLLNQAYFALDALISYLNTNKDLFPTWAAQSNYAQSRDFFINTTHDFDKWVDIRGNYRTLVAMRPIMRNIEASIIKSTLSQDFYNHLKSQIKGSSATADEQLVINEFIQPAIASLTIAKAIKQLQFNITADGAFIHGIKAVSTSNIQEINAPDAEQRDTYATLYQKQGEQWLNDLTDYLNAKASEEMFATYYASSQYTSPDTAVDGYQVDINDPDQKIWY